MNACCTAIEQARHYWQEQGIDLEEFELSARQAPLAGSVWWVQACSPFARHDLLVSRQDKHVFHYALHCPWGYTLYACYKSGEAPLEVVEYEDQAQYRLGVLRQAQRYRACTLTYLANPSASWRDAIREMLADAAQQAFERHTTQVEAYRTVRHEGQFAQQTGEPQRWPLPALSHNDLLLTGSQTQALLTNVCTLLLDALEQQGISCGQATRRTISTFLAGRIAGASCLPWGCMWTARRCLLFVPGDAGSKYELQCWIGWKWGQAYCLWFDGSFLRECAYEELARLLA